MPNFRRSLLPAAALLLAMPAAASAAEYVVDPTVSLTAGCENAPASKTCKTIQGALDKAAGGDVITVLDGSYAENLQVGGREGVVGGTRDQKNLTLQAKNPGKVSLTGASTTAGANTITVGARPQNASMIPGGPSTAGSYGGLADGFKLVGINVSTPPSGGSAVFIRANGVTIESSILSRANTSSSDGAVVQVTSANSTTPATATKIAKTFVLQQTGAAGGLASDTGTLTVEDSVVAAIKGNGVTSSGTGVALVRSQVIAADTTANALALSSPTDSAAHSSRIDSSVLNAGQNGAGIVATTEAGDGVLSDDGAQIQVDAVHTTLAGSRDGVRLDGQGGRVIVGFRGSIVRGVNTVSGDNDALDIVKSDTTQTAAPKITVGGTQTSKAEDLFVDAAKENFLLKPKSPAIDKFDKPGQSESAKDVNGDDRAIGELSDFGADEYKNTPPTATLKADRTEVSRGGTVNFDASGSSDPDGDPVKYLVDFGDGARESFDTPNFSHTYASDGQFAVRMVAYDPSGGISGLFQGLTITVKDGDAPSVSVTSPKDGESIRAFTVKKTKLKGKTKSGKPRYKTTKKTRKITFKGTAADALSGVTRVEVGLQRGLARGTQCAFFDGKSAFKGLPCRKVVYTAAKLSGGDWSFSLRTNSKFKLGSYTVYVRAIDGAGNASAPVQVPITLK